MARTPLFHALRRLMAEHRLAVRERLPVAAVRELRAEAQVRRGATRRQLLVGAAAATALPWIGCKSDESEVTLPAGPRVAIVGGGIAGLSAALTLKDHGVASTVYDISRHRVGGRMVSERGSEPTGCNSCHTAPATAPEMSWSDGQVTDIYGELIDSGHTTIHDLAARFGLELTDALAAQPAGSTETWYFGGNYYTQAEADADFAAVYDAVQTDAEAAGWPVTYDTANAEAIALDDMSLYDWIESRVPGGHTSKLGRLLDVVYCMEFGADTDDQSALNLLAMLSDSPQSLVVLGASDEQYRIRGGVDQLPRAMAEELGLGSAVKLGWDFQALRLDADGTYTLSFDTDAGPTDVKADYVVLAIPFSALRTRDYAQAGFDALKVTAIEDLGAGHNAKLHLQFSQRLWTQSGAWGVGNGTSYSDTGYQLTWDPTRGQPGTSGILVGYTGGSASDAAALMHPYGNDGDLNVTADAVAFLQQVEPVFPGLSALWNGKCAESMAHRDPRFNSSYAYYRVGQTQAFCGYEREPQGNVFFCGEHTSVENQGFMEGAASEGVAVGEAILGVLGVPLATRTGRRPRRRMRRTHL